MALQRTFSIIKPDAVAKNVIGEITTRFEKAGLRVQELRRTNFGTIYYIRCQRPDAPSE